MLEKLFKKLLQVTIDAIICSISVYVSFNLVLGSHYHWHWYHQEAFFSYLIAAVVIMIVNNMIFRIYSINWSYASVREMIILSLSQIAFYSELYVISRFFTPAKYIEIRVFLIFIMGYSLCMIIVRVSYRVMSYLHIQFVKSQGGEGGNILIIGAGESGTLVLMELENNPSRGHVVGYLDDDNEKIGLRIKGVPVISSIDQVVSVAEDYEIDEIFIALPSENSEKIKEVLSLCAKTTCKIMIMPHVSDMVHEDKHQFRQLRSVEPEDLLGRDAVNLDEDDIFSYIENRIVLITGAGGSIGSEICRQISKYNPKHMVLFDIYENSVYDLQHELQRRIENTDISISVIIGSIRDKNRLENVFAKFRPNIVFHAAAHKHVPLMEDSPGEAVKNNIFGTKNVMETADKYNVNRFVMISTDKAVNPTNVMGATKRIAEKVLSCISHNSETEFVAVRFGNVLGSNGSVIPRFKKQIANGGPVTVTHKNITRYFMTITEASQLVVQAGSLAKKGRIFVLDMGDMVKIDDLARNLIRLSGLKPDVDIEVIYTGLRPGEKMYEELLTDNEDLENTKYDKIFVGKTEQFDIDLVNKQLQKLKDCLDKDDDEIIEIIKEMVPEFNHNKG